MKIKTVKDAKDILDSLMPNIEPGYVVHSVFLNEQTNTEDDDLRCSFTAVVGDGDLICLSVSGMFLYLSKEEALDDLVSRIKLEIKNRKEYDAIYGSFRERSKRDD